MSDITYKIYVKMKKIGEITIFSNNKSMNITRKIKI